MLWRGMGMRMQVRRDKESALFGFENKIAMDFEPTLVNVMTWFIRKSPCAIFICSRQFAFILIDLFTVVQKHPIFGPAQMVKLQANAEWSVWWDIVRNESVALLPPGTSFNLCATSCKLSEPFVWHLKHSAVWDFSCV